MTKPLPRAALSYLPMHCGDGYNYGGGIVLTIGDRSVVIAGADAMKGYRPDDMEFAARLAVAWNEHADKSPPSAEVKP